MTYLLLMLGLSAAAIIVNGWIVCAGIIAALMGLGFVLDKVLRWRSRRTLRRRLEARTAMEHLAQEAGESVELDQIAKLLRDIEKPPPS